MNRDVCEIMSGAEIVAKLRLHLSEMPELPEMNRLSFRFYIGNEVPYEVGEEIRYGVLYENGGTFYDLDSIADRINKCPANKLFGVAIWVNDWFLAPSIYAISPGRLV
jgi:hypothetical protein